MDSLYNPITDETVEFGKSVSPMYGAKNAFANQPMKRIAALLPTGGHVSHANRLHHVKGKRVGTVPHGRSQALVRVKGTHQGGFGKADQPQASTGRKVTGTLFNGWHGLVAGKKGRKLGAAGSEVGNALVGSVPGAAMQAAAVRTHNPKLALAGGLTSLAGGRAGAYHGTVVSQRKGRYKAEVAKSFEDLGRQPGMINPGVQTSAWSHGTPNQNFAAASGRKGRKIA